MKFIAGEKIKYRPSEYHPWIDAYVSFFEEGPERPESWRVTKRSRLSGYDDVLFFDRKEDIPRNTLFYTYEARYLKPHKEDDLLGIKIVNKDALHPHDALTHACIRGHQINNLVKKIKN